MMPRQRNCLTRFEVKVYCRQPAPPACLLVMRCDAMLLKQNKYSAVAVAVATACLNKLQIELIKF